MSKKILKKAIVAYKVESPFMGHSVGEICHLSEEEAAPLVEAGLLVEAESLEDEGEEEVIDEEPELVQDSKSMKNLQQKMEDVLVKATEKAIQSVAKTGHNFSGLGAAAEPKQPIIKGIGDLCRTQYYASKGNRTAQNKLSAWQGEISTKAPLGMNEGTPGDGGYSVVPEWYEEIWSKLKAYPKLLEMTDKRTIQSSTLNIPVINETQLDTSREGGIIAYWVGEGVAATPSFPALTQVQLVKNTQVVFTYVTNQLLEDNSYNLDRYLAELVGRAFDYEQNEALVNGAGTTEPVGLLNQPALITVDAEGSQSAATILYANLAKMMARLWPASRANAVFLVTPAAYSQLVQMAFTTSGGYPAPGLGFNAQDEFQLRYLGRPVIEVFNCPQLGLEGDIILADLKQLVCIESPGLQVDMSNQFAFSTLQTAFRFVRRYDIKSPWTSAVTSNGVTYSPFVSLETRGVS